MLNDLLRVEYFPLVVFIFGAIIGSFVNAQALNFFSKKKKARSTCVNCNKMLGFWDLVPIFSYLFLGGKCRYCQKNFSIRYLLVEVFSGLFFALAYLKFDFSAEFLIAVLVFSVALLASLVDLKTQILPDKIIIPSSISLALFYLMDGHFNSTPNDWWVGFLIGVGILGVIFALTLGRGIGFGDVKFAGFLGMVLGGTGSILMLTGTFLLGGMVSAYLLITKKATRKTAIPFGPFIFAGWIIAIFFADKVLLWYTNF